MADRLADLSRPEEWAPGLKFGLKALNTKSVSRARKPSDVLLVCLRHNLRQDNDFHRHRSKIDPARTALNSVLRGSNRAVVADELASNILDELGLSANRKDAIMAIELVFQPPDGHDIDEFFDACMYWADGRYQHIVSAVVHRDQKRPHMHLLALPISDGRLAGAAMTSHSNRSQIQRMSFMTHIRAALGLRPDRERVQTPGTRSKSWTGKASGHPLHTSGGPPHAHLPTAAVKHSNLLAHDILARDVLALEPPGPTDVLTQTSILGSARAPSASTSLPCPPGAESDVGFDQEAFEERAAIMEFDGGLSRAEAEAAAFALMMGEAGNASMRALAVQDGSLAVCPLQEPLPQRPSPRPTCTDECGVGLNHFSTVRSPLGAAANSAVFDNIDAPTLTSSDRGIAGRLCQSSARHASRAKSIQRTSATPPSTTGAGPPGQP